MIDCFIATCAQLPALDPDDRLFAQALTDLGVRVTAAVWDDPAVDWERADVCVVRSTWDYHMSPGAFASWIDAVSTRTCLLNPAHVTRWNAHKFYLRDLEERGIPIVPTMWLSRDSVVYLDALLDRAQWPEAVIKPAYGASADGILRVGPRGLDRRVGQLHLDQLLAQQDVLVQPYLASLADRHERALVFIAGEYSHAVTKTPFMHANLDTARRAQLPPGASGELPVRATPAEIEAASRALGAAPEGHVFARVDIVPDDDTVRIMEVELIEPTLYLYADEGAAHKLAVAILARVDTACGAVRTGGSR
jgi:glutathione synthase/RimK-type ligase-like ATP-grasp enzyme